MPSVAVPSVNDGVTLNPPGTALCSVMVKVSVSPSTALALAIVNTGSVSSSLRIVPVAVDVAVTLAEVPETLRPTVNVSSSSSSASWVVATVNVCVSPAVPAKLIAAVFAV